MTAQPGRPTDEQLLAFEREHKRDGGRKDEAIRAELGISAPRYYQLLGRLIWTEEALAIDPMLTNRLRRLSMERIAEQNRRAGVRR